MQSLSEQQQHIAYLWKQFTRKQATSLQVDELFNLLGEPVHEELALQLMENYLQEDQEQAQIDRAYWLAKLNEILPEQQPAPVVQFRWVRYAAAILLVLGVGAYLFLQNRPKQVADNVKHEQADILPGGNKATLTLADGKTIVLDTASNGNLARQGNTQIVKKDSGALAYLSGSANGTTEYNTITTPKGGQYQVTLPDGSRIWLNSASSVKFPTAFNDKARTIEIAGEIYMEVAKKVDQPFTVVAGNTSIQVLGTAFNINSYPDEPDMKTTLVDGSIKVIRGNEVALLKPGQQARIQDASANINVVKADIDQVIAWKDGYFNFNGADIKTMMRQIGRWYDLEIVYEGEPAHHIIEGEMGRMLTLSNTMEVLKGLNIKYRVEGRKLIVMQ